MKKNLLTIAIVAAVVAGVAAFNSYFEPARATAAQLEQQQDAQSELQLAADMIDETLKNAAAEKTDEVQLAQAETGAAPDAAAAAAGEETKEAPAPLKRWKAAEEWPAAAPDDYRVKFETSAGDFVLECHKDWAPLGAERFYTLCKEGYYNETRFFRVVPGFMVQWGMAADPALGAIWRDSDIPDDPVKQTNAPGYISFASRGPNTRTTQVFINYGDNARLDGMGFAPFGQVVEGFDNVKKINAEYREQPQQGRIQAHVGEGDIGLGQFSVFRVRRRAKPGSKPKAGAASPDEATERAP